MSHFRVAPTGPLEETRALLILPSTMKRSML